MNGLQNLFSLAKNAKRGLGLAFDFAFGLTISLFILIILTGLAPLLQAKVLGNIVNSIVEALQSAGDLHQVTLFAILYAVIYGAIRILNHFDLFLGKTWRTEVEHGLELTILKKRSEIDLGHYENSEFQNLMQRALYRSIWPVFEITEAQFQTFANLAVIIVSSIITASISWQIYVIVLLTSLPSFFVQLKYGHKVWGIYAEHSERQRKYLSMRQHLVGRLGVTQSKILQNSDHLLAIIRETLESFKRDNVLLDKKRFWYQAVASMIAAVGFGISLVFIARNALTGEISVGSVVFMISALGSLIGSMNSLLALIATQLEKNLFATDIFKILDTKPFVVRDPNPVKLNLTAPPTIEFVNVSFKYPGRDAVILDDVTLTINPGEKIALVGMNGAGKSTLVKLLSRIYDPDDGVILINGIDLKKLDIDEWTSHLSVLLQDYLAYDVTVSESIAIGRTEKPVDSTLVEEAANYSGANEFIETWENKYSQQLGKEYQGGVEPSKGQHQKIALARTIYRKGYVMVLDEPTAAIDALSETRIFEQMEKAVGNNTLIVITHRFNTTQSLDKIVVLEHGKIVEIGTHRELIDLGGLYKEMFESQAKVFLAEAADKPRAKVRKPRSQPKLKTA